MATARSSVAPGRRRSRATSSTPEPGRVGARRRRASAGTAAPPRPGPGSARPPGPGSPRPSRAPPPISSAACSADSSAAVRGLDGDPGTPGQHVLQVQRPLGPRRVRHLGGQVLRRARPAADAEQRVGVDQGQQVQGEAAVPLQQVLDHPDRHPVPAGQVGPVPPQRRDSRPRRAAADRRYATRGPPPSRRTARSTTSAAITRYVVYLPPATSSSPSIGSNTACSRESLEVESASPESSGRSPA